MKKQLLLCLFAALQTGLNAQGYYTRYYHTPQLQRQAHRWVVSGAWKHGFSRALPHKTVNAIEFYEQYNKNPQQWQAMFKWLQNTPLNELPAGKYPIPNTNLVASVEVSTNAPLQNRQSESHYHHIDFQWVIQGVERFGIIDHYTSTPSSTYKPDVIHYNYNISKTKFFDSSEQRFFIFFPGDWHIAKIETPKKKQQNIKVVVVKLAYQP